jgi:hypothetical protein
MTTHRHAPTSGASVRHREPPPDPHLQTLCNLLQFDRRLPPSNIVSLLQDHGADLRAIGPQLETAIMGRHTERALDPDEIGRIACAIGPQPQIGELCLGLLFAARSTAKREALIDGAVSQVNAERLPQVLAIADTLVTNQHTAQEGGHARSAFHLGEILAHRATSCGQHQLLRVLDQVEPESSSPDIDWFRRLTRFGAGSWRDDVVGILPSATQGTTPTPDGRLRFNGAAYHWAMQWADTALQRDPDGFRRHPAATEALIALGLNQPSLTLTRHGVSLDIGTLVGRIAAVSA